jgi:hypothetical protein
MLGLGLGIQFNKGIFNRLFIAKYGQPAVGLSYRDLLGTDPIIILSRRDSDDLEASFKVSEIANGAYLNWVNEKTTLFDEDFATDVGWTLASGVTISGGKLNFSSAGNNTSSAVYAYGSADFQTVRITVEVTDYVSGRIRANNFSGGATTSPDIEANGTYVYEVTLGDGGTSWGFGSSTGTTLKVASFKVEQLTANGLLRTLYGQGNTLNAEQATASAQPKIVDAGVLVTKNGLPGMRFDGVNDSLDLTNEVNLNNYFITQVISPTAYNTRVILGKNLSDYIRLDNTSGYRINPGGAFTSSTSVIGDQMLLTQKRNTSDNINLSKNGVESAEVFNNNTQLNILRIGQANGIWFFEGIMQEVIIYASDKTSEQAAIESNTMAYWKRDRYLLQQDSTFILQQNGKRIIL